MREREKEEGERKREKRKREERMRMRECSFVRSFARSRQINRHQFSKARTKKRRRG